VIAKADRYWQKWNDQAHRQGVLSFWKDDPEQRERREHLYNVMTPLFPRLKGRTLLDFGCGTGEDYPFLSGSGFTYRGVDITPEMIAVAQQAHPGADVGIDDILQSSQSDNSHALVVNNAILLHLPFERLWVAVKELYRVASEAVVIRYPGVDNFPEDRLFEIGGFLYNRITYKTFVRLMESCAPQGLEIERGGTPGTRDVCIATLWKAKQ